MSRDENSKEHSSGLLSRKELREQVIEVHQRVAVMCDLKPGRYTVKELAACHVALVWATAYAKGHTAYFEDAFDAIHSAIVELGSTLCTAASGWSKRLKKTRGHLDRAIEQLQE